MKRMIENMTGHFSSTACVVDGTLILSLPDALTPVVWRLDLGHAKASAIEVREKEDGKFTLLLKTPRGDVNDIAEFDLRGRAISALMAITRAMEESRGEYRNSHTAGGVGGQIHDAAAPYNAAHLPVPVRHGRKNRSHAAHHNSGNGKAWIGGIVAIILIILLSTMVMNMGPQHIYGTAPINAATGSNAALQSGVPVSADDFLRNR